MHLLFRNLGKTHKKVSILGFGCMRLPILDGCPNKINEPLATKMIQYAIDHGVNYVDTAYPYHGISFTEGGMSETFLGKTLKNGYRDQVYIATKLPSWLIQKKEDMDRYLNEQLNRLQTDRIDFYLIHGLNQDLWNELSKLDACEFLDTAIDDGKIGYAGFSFHDKAESFNEIVDSYNWSFAQIQYNYMDQDFQAGKDGLDYLAEKGLGTVIMEPLKGGSLTSNIPNDVKAIWGRAVVKRTAAEWSLRYLWDHSEIDLVLSGMSTMEHVKENVKIAEEGIANSLTDFEKDLIEAVKEAYKERIHVGCSACNYCMPCKNGVNIPQNLNLLNEYYIYQNMPKTLGAYSFLSANEASASFCTECGECEEKCTQDIPIREFLRETVKTFEK
jgi:uncharacterized protein